MARLWTIIFSLFLITSLSEVYAKNPPPGTGTTDIPANILIMLDNSGSMSARLAGAVQIHYPVDVNVDSNGNIYVLEYWNNRIKKFDSSGNYLKSFGGPGNGCSQWRSARQFDIKDNIIDAKKIPNPLTALSAKLLAENKTPSSLLPVLS